MCIWHQLKLNVSIMKTNKALSPRWLTYFPEACISNYLQLPANHQQWQLFVQKQLHLFASLRYPVEINLKIDTIHWWTLSFNGSFWKRSTLSPPPQRRKFLNVLQHPKGAGGNFQFPLWGRYGCLLVNLHMMICLQAREECWKLQEGGWCNYT